MEELNPNQASRPIIATPSIERAAAVLTNVGFVAFSRILGLRVHGGDMVSALRMLTILGAPDELAYEILDGWTTTATRRMPADLVTLPEEAAIRLAHYIDDLDAYDWPEVLGEAARGAKAKRDEDAADAEA